jgi:hypothetical protein
MRTTHHPTGRSPRRLALVVSVALVALVGVAPAISAAARQTGEDSTTVQVYFLREGKVAAASRVVELDPAKQVGKASIQALIDGPTEEEQAAGLASAVPGGTEFLGLTIDDVTGVATLDLSAVFAAPLPTPEATPPADVAPTARARLAQVVYTLTQFPTVAAVRLSLDGQPVETFDPDGEGGEAATDLSEGVARSDFEDVTPLIFVETPTVGEAIGSPVRVAGTANVFEAVFFVQVRDDAGNVLAEQQVMATSGTGTRGTFDAEVTFDFGEPGPGALVFFDRSPRDGAMENVVEIPVVFVRPAGP